VRLLLRNGAAPFRSLGPLSVRSILGDFASISDQFASNSVNYMTKQDRLVSSQ